ncbi:hypothetical protein GCM10007424_11510 [Flavobacterium suaedae]|uniref:DUF4468 domain-containing protein n=1 Tax=Flavobacterium suaedae TaxID=1767027 RepID=A0ABQ1JNJ2_9FLAO|nr:hypothetical protein [Flavobacterium suaedae]GGB73309.1 hypothetical protein GCM10007424_11510 [Flavobacterium suaedae]
MMIKKILINIVIFYITNSLYSQTQSVDSVSIAFKAKLFTVSEYGIANKEQILLDIESQEAKFLKTVYKNFFFLKIKFSQPYRNSNISVRTLNRKCYYYIAFNIIENRFYRLGGFNSLDVIDFISDLGNIENINIENWNKDLVQEIDIDCLYEYYYLDDKKRFKKKFLCFPNCNENTKTYYMEHKDNGSN